MRSTCNKFWCSIQTVNQQNIWYSDGRRLLRLLVSGLGLSEQFQNTTLQALSILIGRTHFFSNSTSLNLSLPVRNLPTKSNTYTDKSSKVANHLHIQRAGTRFEPGNDTKYRNPNSSFIIVVIIFCLMPGTSWRKRLEANSSEWTRHPNSLYLFALPIFIITFCYMLHIRWYLYTLPTSLLSHNYMD